jgi:hypothetical protein
MRWIKITQTFTSGGPEMVHDDKSLQHFKEIVRGKENNNMKTMRNILVC